MSDRKYEEYGEAGFFHIVLFPEIRFNCYSFPKRATIDARFFRGRISDNDWKAQGIYRGYQHIRVRYSVDDVDIDCVEVAILIIPGEVGRQIILIYKNSFFSNSS